MNHTTKILFMFRRWDMHRLAMLIAWQDLVGMSISPEVVA